MCFQIADIQSWKFSICDKYLTSRTLFNAHFTKLAGVSNIKVSNFLSPIDVIITVFHTAKWIWDSSIFFSIKPKLDMWLFVCFLCFWLNLPHLNLNLFCFDVQNIFRFRWGKFSQKHRNQQTIACQVFV